MSKVLVTDTSLSDIADAIRAQNGGAATYKPGEMAAAIVAIPTSGSSSDITLQAKTATPSENSQTIVPDSGYDGLSSVTVGAISSSYVGSAVTQKAAATYTPGTADQTIAAGQYLSGAQTIEGDANLTAANIKSGTSIFGVTGSYGGDSSGSSYQSASGTITTDSSGYAYITEDELPFVPDIVVLGPWAYGDYPMCAVLYFGGDSSTTAIGAGYTDSGMWSFSGSYSDGNLKVIVIDQGWNWGTTYVSGESIDWAAYKF